MKTYLIRCFQGDSSWGVSYLTLDFPLLSTTEQDLENGWRTLHQRLLPRQDGCHSGRAGGRARHCPGLPVPVTVSPYWPTAALRSPEGLLLTALKKKPILPVPAAVCVSPVCVCGCVFVCVCVNVWVCVSRPLLQVFGKTCLMTTTWPPSVRHRENVSVDRWYAH